MTLAELNEKKWIIILGNGMLFWITFMIFILFLILKKYSFEYEEVESYKQITIDLNSPIVEGGIILIVGLFAMIISKIVKSNLLIIVVGILTLIIYYIKMLWTGI
ncbi:hypothetical protein [Kordia jejudonensis]|uniref:hypothetical protein n=1 Tax=Kordia jejudonensis TaxID=1348245 RepID=UPI0006291460|nr:hypothetical protein [Kordia jejudonensis]